MMGRRFWAMLIAFFVIVGFATGRSVAEGEGYSVPARGSLGFTPATNPLRVVAPDGVLHNVTWAQAGTPIRLADGSMSASDTVYLRLESLTANDAVITQTVNGRSLSMTNLNGGDPATAARIGAAGTTVDVWFRVTSLEVCINAATLTTIVNSYAASFGAQLPNVLAQITQIFGPGAGTVGPCVQLAKLIPLLAVIVQAGVPLPPDLPVKNVELMAYAVNIAAADGVDSLVLPVVRIEVENA